jgi:heptaprenyl diphosphate synthase
MLAGAPTADVETVARFGEVIGGAFQLSDDLIDVLSDAEDSGKTPGTDLREGIRTLPVLLALASDDPAGERLRALLQADLSDDALLTEALDLLRASPAVDAARARLTASVAEARDVAGALPEGPAREALVALTDVVAQRTG